MENKSNKVQKDEALRIENQVRKLKLELEHGAKFGSFNPDSQLPPHIEKMFLDNVERIEKSLKEAKKIKIYDLLGRPEFKKAESLNDEELVLELDKVHGWLYEHSIFCNSVYQIENRKFYAFITEELFEELVNDIRVPGFIASFFYETYHPNHQAEISDMGYDIITALLHKNDNFDFGVFEASVTNAKKLHNFRDSYSRFEINTLEVESVAINENSATAVFIADFTGSIEASSLKQTFCEKITLDLSLDSMYWNVIKISFPGLKED